MCVTMCACVCAWLGTHRQLVGITISFFIGIRVEIRLKGVCEHTRMEIGVEIAIVIIPYRGTMIVPSRCMHGNVLQ